jgi:diphosphomevalonate decarboxylase
VHSSSSSREAVAIAHPNVALSKYWGKREGTGNFPAVPSLSITLGGLSTRTRVTWRRDASTDRIVLDGQQLNGAAAERALALVDRVRRLLGLSAYAEIDSRNDFPTASGLASSASGFAALALAAVHGAADWDAARVSDLARTGSASAARSIFGGFVELDAGPVDPGRTDRLAARPLAPPNHLPLAVLVCVTTQMAKTVGSTEGMRATMARSPYAQAWLDCAPRLHRQLVEALLAKDFDAVGTLSEASAFAMHACAIAAGVRYWNAGTIEALAVVRELRQRGTAAYATIDAGPHVKVLVRPADADRARSALSAVAGVLRVIEASPGEGARLLPAEEVP